MHEFQLNAPQPPATTHILDVMILLERTSYSTKLPKDDSQVAGYRGERNRLLALLHLYLELA